MWLARSRFADVARLAELTLTPGWDARAFYQLGWAKQATGSPAAALAAYDQALGLYRAAGDRGNEAATLNNIGLRVRRSGRPAAGAGVLRAGAADPAGGRGPGRGGGHAEQHRRAYTTVWGSRQRALEYYGQALPIAREVGDRAGEAATLNNIGAVYNGLGERQRALEYYGQALPIMREVGDRAGEATTLNNIGRVQRSG